MSSIETGRRAGALLLLVPLLVLALVTPPGASAQQRVSLSGNGAIYNLVGQVRLEAGSGPNVIVQVQRQGRDGDQLKVESGRVADWQVLRVVYPDDDIVYDRQRWGNSSFDVRANGTFNDRGFWRQAGVGDAASALLNQSEHRVRIRGSGSGVHAYADLVVQVPAGRQVAVFLGVGRVDAENVNGKLWVATNSGDAVLSRVQGGLHVSSGSGDLRLEELSGDLVASTGSGDVTLRGARGALAQLSTGSGDVRGGNLAVQELRAETGSGDVQLDAVAAQRTQARSGSGDVSLALMGAVQELRISTGSGDVRLKLPGGIGARLHLSTGSGGIDTSFPVTITRRRQDSLEGTIGDGRGSIDVNTGSGSVSLTRS